MVQRYLIHLLNYGSVGQAETTIAFGFLSEKAVDEIYNV